MCYYTRPRIISMLEYPPQATLTVKYNRPQAILNMKEVKRYKMLLLFLLYILLSLMH